MPPDAACVRVAGRGEDLEGSGMTARQVLLADIAGAGGDLKIALERAGWEVHQASSIAVAQATAKLGACQVGVIVFPAHSDAPVQDIEALTASTPMEWIAVLPA